MKRLVFSVSILASLALVAGCDSDPASSSAPPSIVVAPTTTGPTVHGPDNNGHDVGIADIHDHQFTLKLNDGDTLTKLMGKPGETPAYVVQNSKVLSINELRDQESYCSFSDSRDDDKFTTGQTIEMTDLQISQADGQQILDAKSKDQTVDMVCYSKVGSDVFKVTDLDNILGGLVTVDLDR